MTRISTFPDREMLRTLYDEAIKQINPSRSAIDLTTGFYSKTGNAVFEAGYLALSDYCKGPAGPHRLHTVSAPAGGGKTSYSYALMLALTKYAEETQGSPYGCVFVVNQIKKADEAFQDLNALAPGKVAVWTIDHDPRNKNKTRVLYPAREFTKEELRRYPIIIVTHTFYNGRDGNKAHVFVRDKRVFSGRALTVVDERPEEVEHYEITLTEAQSVREKLEGKRPDLRDTLDKLMRFIWPDTLAAVSGVIMRTSDHFGEDIIADQLSWFHSSEAEGVRSHHREAIPGLDQFLGFARALATGCAFAVKIGQVVQFIGWKRKIRLWSAPLGLGSFMRRF